MGRINLFRFYMLMYGFIVCLWIVSGQEIMTPVVQIFDISPDSKSDRVVFLTTTLTRVDAILGENLIFECSVIYLAAGKPILWKFMTNTSSITLNDGMKSLDSSKYRISQGTAQGSIRLEIMSVGYASAGTYMCEVFYDDRSTEIRRSRLIVVYESPRFLVQSTSFETAASVGDKLRLTCAAAGSPTPRIYWERSAGSSSVIRNYGRQVDGGEIVFDGVQASDRGTYICKAINRIGTSQWPVRLSVSFQPMVRFEGGASARQKVGCTLELLCIVEANPAPSETGITVSKDGTTLKHGVNGIRVFFMRGADSTFYLSVFIYPFAASHAGTYTCTATNAYKDNTGSATISVTTSDVAVPGRTGSAVCSGSSGCFVTPSGALLLLAVALAAAAPGKSTAL